MNIKHGEGQLGNIKNATIELFDADVELGEGQSVQLKTKHSSLEMGNLENMTMNVFDSEITLKNIRTSFNVKEKHSTIIANHIGTGKWKMFDSKVKIANAKKLEIDGKHGKYELKKISHLILKGFDTRFTIDQIGELACKQTKHSKLKIQELQKSAALEEVFDLELTATSLSPTFSKIDFRGKHSKLRLSTPPAIPYKIDLDLQHSNLNYNESTFNILRHIEKSVFLELEAVRKGAKENAPLIKVKGHALEITLE